MESNICGCAIIIERLCYKSHNLLHGLNESPASVPEQTWSLTTTKNPCNATPIVSAVELAVLNILAYAGDSPREPPAAHSLCHQVCPLGPRLGEECPSFEVTDPPEPASNKVLERQGQAQQSWLKPDGRASTRL